MVCFYIQGRKCHLLLEFLKYTRDVSAQGDGTLLPHFHFDEEPQYPKDMSQHNKMPFLSTVIYLFVDARKISKKFKNAVFMCILKTKSIAIAN